NLGAPVPVAGGTASMSTSALAVGTHSLTAVFTPADPTLFNGSTSAAVSLVVNSAPATPTTTTLTVSPSGTVPTRPPVTLTATVSPSGATGKVQFMDNGRKIDGAEVVSGGQAVKVVKSFKPGTHVLTAQFIPDTTAFLGSTSDPVTLVVTRAAMAAFPVGFHRLTAVFRSNRPDFL